MSEEVEEVTHIHGDHDKYGIGKVFDSICGLLIVVAICLTCSGNWGIFFDIFK